MALYSFIPIELWDALPLRRCLHIQLMVFSTSFNRITFLLLHVFFTMWFSRPHRRLDISVSSDIYLFLKTLFRFGRFAFPVFFRISISYIPASVKIFPTYLNSCTCLLLMFLIGSSHLRLFLLLTGIYSVFL